MLLACRTLVLQLIEHHRDHDCVGRGRAIGGVPARRGLGGETNQLPETLQPLCHQGERKGKCCGVMLAECVEQRGYRGDLHRVELRDS